MTLDSKQPTRDETAREEWEGRRDGYRGITLEDGDAMQYFVQDDENPDAWIQSTVLYGGP